MPRINIPLTQLANKGINKDIDAHNLPMDTWSDGSNVRMIDGAVESSSGHLSVYNSSPPAEPAHFTIPVTTTSSYIWVAATLDHVYKQVGDVWTDITRASGVYTGTADDRWTGGMFGGLLVLNNGVDAPQIWNGAAANLLTLDWETGVSTWLSKTYSCKAMRPYKSFLVALDLDYNGTRHPQRVQWSNITAAGAHPSSWDDTDDTVEAGYTDLIKGGGYVVDCLELGGTNIIYRAESTHTMDYNPNSSNIMDFDRLPFDRGIMGRGCAAEFLDMHAVFTRDGIIAHDGRTIKHYITNQRMRKWIAGKIDPDTFERSFIVPQYKEDEIWFCFPEQGASFATIVIIWNYHNDTLVIKDLPSATHISHGAVDPNVDDSWAVTGTWEDQGEADWDKVLYKPMQNNLLMATNESTLKLYQMDETFQNDGANQTCWIERLSLPLSVTKDGQPVLDPTNTKNIGRLWPIMTGTEGGEIQFKIGSQETPADPVTWSETKTFTIGADRYLDFSIDYNYLSIQILSSSNIKWRLTDLIADIVDTGNR